jgi:hypothetical protein
MEMFMNRIGGRFIPARIAAACCLGLSGLSEAALADDAYCPTEPPSAASDRGMVFDTPIYNYAATCGGRLDIVTIRRLSARMLENGVSGGTCSYIFTPE